MQNREIKKGQHSIESVHDLKIKSFTFIQNNPKASTQNIKQVIIHASSKLFSIVNHLGGSSISFLENG